MAEYSVGVATKAKIYDAAKQLFYEKGIRRTSYTDICAVAGVNRGLIPYHFKSKANIAIDVLNEFYQGLELAASEHWGKDELSKSVFHIIIELLMFRLLSTNRHILSFYSEVFCSDEFHHASLAEQQYILREVAGEPGASLSEEAFQTIACMVNGVEGELVLALKEGLPIEGVEDFVRRDITLLRFLMGADIEAANQACDEAIELSRGLTFECGPDFRCHVAKA